MIGCESLVDGTLVGNGAFGERMAQIVLNDLLYGHIRIETKAEDVVQVGSADRIQDRKFLCTNHSRTR